jgi:hypothetical protein
VVPDVSKAHIAFIFQEFSRPWFMDHSTELLRMRTIHSFEESETTVSHSSDWNPLLYGIYPRSLPWELLPLSCRVTDSVSFMNFSIESDISIWKPLAVTHNHNNKSVVIQWCYMLYIIIPAGI